MQKAVEDFLKKHEKRQKELEKKKREKLLIKAGLQSKQYSPDNKYSEEYCQCEYSDTGLKYYKIVALDVTNEEYEKIKKYINKENLVEDQKYYKCYKAIPKIMLWTMIILGAILGIALSTIEEEPVFFIIWTLVGVVLGFVYFIICKIAISPTILQTEYLKILADKEKEN